MFPYHIEFLLRQRSLLRKNIFGNAYLSQIVKRCGFYHRIDNFVGTFVGIIAEFSQLQADAPHVFARTFDVFSRRIIFRFDEVCKTRDELCLHVADTDILFILFLKTRVRRRYDVVHKDNAKHVFERCPGTVCYKPAYAVERSCRIGLRGAASDIQRYHHHDITGDKDPIRKAFVVIHAAQYGHEYV